MHSYFCILCKVLLIGFIFLLPQLAAAKCNGGGILQVAQSNCNQTNILNSKIDVIISCSSGDVLNQAYTTEVRSIHGKSEVDTAAAARAVKKLYDHKFNSLKKKIVSNTSK